MSGSVHTLNGKVPGHGQGRYRIAKHTLLLQRVLRRFTFWHVYDPVDVKTDFLGVGGPMLVAEAVGVTTVSLGVEGVVARADSALVDLVVARRILDLMTDTSVSLAP